MQTSSPISAPSRQENDATSLSAPSRTLSLAPSRNNHGNTSPALFRLTLARTRHLLVQGSLVEARGHLQAVFKHAFIGMESEGNRDLEATSLWASAGELLEAHARIPQSLLIEAFVLTADLYRLEGKEDAYPGELSGGQQQRVAIARSLAMSPDVMLFDEVTAALDPETVKEVLVTIKDLAQEGMTCILVTHEMGFAREIADHIYFTDNGVIVEHGPPATFFSKAKDPRTKEFLSQIL